MLLLACDLFTAWINATNKKFTKYDLNNGFQSILKEMVSHASSQYDEYVSFFSSHVGSQHLEDFINVLCVGVFCFINGKKEVVEIIYF